MEKFAVYFKPNHFGLDIEGMILILAKDEAEAVNEVLYVSGIGHENGEVVFPKTVTRVAKLPQ